MKFVEKFLKKHHLKQNPHKWFFATLLSPIHTAEMHYKKHYHLRFVHARKLFLFDMFLFLSIIVIFCAGLFWWTYDPTVADLVYLSITPNQERLISGQEITYTIQYNNESDIILTHPTVTLAIPSGLSISNFSPSNILFDQSSHTFTLSSIPAHTSGMITFSGTFFATPHIENTTHATLSYTQKDKEKRERKTSPTITIVRDSIIELTINMPDQVLNNSPLPFTLDIQNNGDVNVFNIMIPLSPPPHTTIQPGIPTMGYVQDNIWYISSLLPKDSAELSSKFIINTTNNITKLVFPLTPVITFDDQHIDQKTVDKDITILHPHIQISSKWDTSYVQPDTTNQLSIELKNTTDITFTDIDINLPATPYSTKQTQHITTLKPQETQTLTLPITIIHTGSTTDIDPVLILTPEITAHISHILQDIYTTQHNTDAIPIGSNIFLNTKLRYYTAEGDQLGRGPLPPTVGKETKYWAFIHISNTTSHIKNLYLNATLPDYVTWTGKTSVSHGQDVQYDEATKQLTWSHVGLNPHTTAGIYIELAITPTTEMRGTTPTLLQNISFSARDTYIDIPISRTARSIDISLPNDPIGNSKGISVQ